MSGRRAIHLLWNEPGLFLRKAWLHVTRWCGYAGAARGSRDKQATGRATIADASDLLSILARDLPLVILERRRSFVACAVRAVDVPVLLTRIVETLPRAIPLIDGRPASLRLAALVRDSHRAKTVSVQTPPGSGEMLWQFFIYDPTGTGSYVSRQRSDAIAGVLYEGLLDRPGATELSARMPELSRKTRALPIDIVYAFVDSTDPAWRKAFAAARPPSAEAGGDALADGRFHSSDELRYSLRSVAQHLPWAGTIHIVSNCSQPSWLDPAHPKLRWVPHEQILDSACLPTFNSHAIEASLHRIPDLTENFLYFNDDFFAFSALAPEDFVNENGTLNANLEPLAAVNGRVDPNAPDYLNAARNGAKLLHDRYGYYPTRLHMHAPYSLRRSLLEELEGEFKQAVEETRRARFRSITDISVASFFAHHYGFARREVVYAGYPTELITSADPFFALNMRRIASAAEKPKIVCLNEGGAPSPRWRRRLVRFMTRQFPSRAPWERDA